MKNQEVKILILSYYDISTYTLRFETITAFLDLGYEVIISAPYGCRIRELKALGCSFVETKFDNRGTSVKDDFKLFCHYRRLLREVKPHVVLTYMIKPNIYGGIAASIENIPVIANITGLGRAAKNNGLIAKLTLSLYSIAFKKVFCLFFQNEENLKLFQQKKIARGREKLLPGSGVNLDKFKPLPYPDRNKTSFVFIARIIKEKGIDQYLDTALHIKERHPNTFFHICGSAEDDYKSKLEQYEHDGIITYHGRIDDVRKILKDMHCIIHPSYYPEGMSNVLLEGGATARALITTNHAGCREIVDNGENGFICESRNSNDLIAKVELFLSKNYEEKREMGQKSRAKVEKKFDRNIVVQYYLDAVNSI